ncbi:hypothetical protein DPMN_191361 [Dreissena polymorpha]|uniref:Uncharacterized protein n=1 Tax=Dreissena polymorpha TaxID=45954 RepID=A0A9D3Y104_DREPO|nr:hypothetical protein DPMN_191361 [Dreissena polymorpha]
MLFPLRRAVVYFWRIPCLKITHCLIHLYLKYGRSFVVSFWYGIVLKDIPVRLKRVGVEATAINAQLV